MTDLTEILVRIEGIDHSAMALKKKADRLQMLETVQEWHESYLKNKLIQAVQETARASAATGPSSGAATGSARSCRIPICHGVGNSLRPQPEGLELDFARIVQHSFDVVHEFYTKKFRWEVGEPMLDVSRNEQNVTFDWGSASAPVVARMRATVDAVHRRYVGDVRICCATLFRLMSRTVASPQNVGKIVREIQKFLPATIEEYVQSETERILDARTSTRGDGRAIEWARRLHNLAGPVCS